LDKEGIMLPAKILSLKERLIEMASLVETMIDKSIKGLLEKKNEILKEVIEKNELHANELEIEIHELCINLIALYQPKAKDLRLILTILQINNDLERIGDHAEDIADHGLYLIERPLVKPLIDIPRMAEETIAMLKNSISAFINEDTKLAREVIERDDIVDGLNNQILRELITYMTSDSGTIERSIHLLKISKHLERAADLSTNISEDVIFMVEGKIVRHDKELEK
jgi:phosphate transport system protein